MASHSFSSADLKALSAVNDALLDPLSHDTIEAWLLEVCARFETLCHAPAGFAAYSFADGEARFVSREIPRKFLDRMTEFGRSAPGHLGSGDPTVEWVLDGLRHRVSGVATTADLVNPAAGLPFDQVKELPMFRDVACPLGVPGSTLLFHSGASGEYMVHAALPEVEARPFGEATEAIVGSLLPAFAASVGALARLGDARRALAGLLDAVEDGATVFDAAGRRVLVRNAAMAVLLRQEFDAEALERTIFQAAQAAAWTPRGPKSGSALPASTALSRAWRSTRGTPYRLRSVRLPPGSVTPQDAVVVLVQRVGPPVPELRELMQRFRLTRREADVAQRLAYGRSDREIATDLGLSPHTVRHHAEAVFIKVGVNSRKALAIHLGPKVEQE